MIEPLIEALEAAPAAAGPLLRAKGRVQRVGETKQIKRGANGGRPCIFAFKHRCADLDRSRAGINLLCMVAVPRASSISQI